MLLIISIDFFSDICNSRSMNNFTRFFKKLWYRIPSPLPRGMTEFQTWSQQIIEVYDLPNNDSVTFMIGAVLLQLGPTDAYKSRSYFGNCGLMASAKEIAHATLTELKTKQEAKIKAEAAAATNVTPITGQQEATVTPITSASNVTASSTPPTTT